MSFYVLPASLEQDIAVYTELVNQYRKGFVSKAKLKAFCGPFGVYEQRNDNRYMMRIRLPGGAVTPAQLSGLGRIAEKYSDWPLHCTTRQDLQIHNLLLQDTVLIMQELRSIGLSTRGGGGNTVRNILGSADTGADSADAFDVSPYIQALTTRMISEPDSWTLPRKFKIAFSGNKRDRGFATVNDLGFIAVTGPDGKRGFRVYIAGGMGSRPAVGKLLYDFLEDNEVYNVAKAVKNLFDRHGNRRNRHQARLRYILYREGWEKFSAFYKEEYAAVKARQYPILELPAVEKIKSGFLEIPLFLGDITAAELKAAGNILEKYGEDIIRLTPEQNLLIRNINEQDQDRIARELRQQGIPESMPALIAHTVSCTGAGTCRLGIGLSRNLVKAVRARLKNTPFDVSKLADITLKVSGCPNSCGQHLLADIGFAGTARRILGKMVPCYQLMTGSRVGDKITCFAEKSGLLPAKAIPDLLYEFLEYTAVEIEDGEPFYAFLQRNGSTRLQALVEKYEMIPAYGDNSDYYHDWYEDKPFSLPEKTTGKCSAGVSDLIGIDFKAAAEKLQQAKLQVDEVRQQNLLTQCTVHTARALLITLGLEPSDDREAVRLFREHFVGKYLEKHWDKSLVRYLEQNALNIPDVEDFLDAVQSLYASMDDSLRFAEMKVKNAETAPLFPVYDFRGIGCPVNFVRTKLVLENAEPGEQIEVYLDEGSPAENVPVFVQAEGHKIVTQEKRGNYWSVVIEKSRGR